ncbi:MAG TPA: DsbA family protein [Acetobacteraceae bacterium]|nr:DsbA family protein [Acetobacteraceae bacterium]
MDAAVRIERVYRKVRLSRSLHGILRENMRRTRPAFALLLILLAVVAGPAAAQQSSPPAARRGKDTARATAVLVNEDLVEDRASPVLGNPQGDVTMVEFFDYRCPFCKLMAPKLLRLIAADPQLRLVMKEYPILSPQSVTAARAALVASRHGRYAAFHQAMYRLDGPFDEAKLLDVAKQVGLDPAVVRKEMSAPWIDAELRRNLALGQIIGITGTPAFVVDHKLLLGAVPLSTLRRLIADERKTSGAGK